MENSQKNRRRFLTSSAFAAAGAVLIAVESPIAVATLQADSSGGTILRGADGELYFIPDSKLRPFRLSESKAAPVREALRASKTVDAISGRTAKRVGLAHGDDDETMIVIDVGALRQRK